MALFSLACAQIIVTVELLGMVGSLTVGNLAILNGVIAGIALLVPRPAQVPPTEPVKLPSPWSLVPLLFFLTAYLLHLYRVWLWPPLQYDDLTYHFRFPVEWLQTGSLSCPITAFGDPSRSYAPLNTELLNFWVMAPLGSDQVARILHPLFMGFCVVLVMVLLRDLGLTRNRALLLALSFGSMPYVITQGLGTPLHESSAHDLTVLAFFLIALRQGLLYFRAPTRGRITLFGVSLGLLMGSKIMAALHGLPLLAWLVWIIWSSRQSRRETTIQLALLVVPLILLGGYVYGRNWIETGNPIFPAEVGLPGWVLFSGSMSRAALSNSIFHRRLGWWEILCWPGFGPGWIGLLLLGMITQAGSILARKRWRSTGREDRFLSLLPLTSLLIFAFLIPYQHMRFLFIPLIGAILSTGILIRTRCRLGTAMMLFLIPTIVASSGGIVLNCLSNSDWKPGGDYGWYSSQKPGWEHVQEIGREVETPLRIAYAGCNTPYKLYGPDFRNRVYYVPVNGIGSRLHHYRLQQYNYRAMASPITWRDNLLEQETDMLVVHPAAQWEMHWANRMPETFTRVFMDQGTSIFAVSHPTTPPIGPTIRLGALECRGFELRPRVVRSGGSLELTITWSVPEPMRGRSLEIRYQVEGIGQWTDHYPCPSASPRIIHRGVLPIPSDAPPGLRIIEAHLREPGSVPPVTCRLGDLEILPPSTARPAPPEILLPLDGQILDHHQSFRWDPVPGALGYKAEYQDPSGVIRHLRSRQNDLDLLLPPDFPASLGAGEYRWRVAAWCSDGTWSTFSPWRRFRTSAQESDPASSSSSASVPSSNRSRHSLVGRPVSGSQPLSR